MSGFLWFSTSAGVKFPSWLPKIVLHLSGMPAGTGVRSLICIFLCIVGPCSAQELDPSARAAADAATKTIRVDALRAHMRFLSDSLLEGRAPGTRGYDIAARYVATQLESMTLQPAGAQGTWFQTVPLRKAVNDRRASSFVLSNGGKELKLEDTADYVLLADLSRTESEVEGPVVFVGYGVSAPELNYDDYRGIDAHGKIVVWIANAPPRFSSSQRGYYSDAIVKGKNAIAHGAVGVLGIALPADEERDPWRWRFPQIQMGLREWIDTQGVPHDSLPEIRGWAVLSPQGAEKLFLGAPKKSQEVFSAAEASQPQAFPLPWKARIHTVSSHQLIESVNVVGNMVGSDPVLRNQYLIYTAHLDHLGLCPPLEGDNVCHGAIDNASGVATLLEIARAYTSLPRPPRRSILFLFVTGEEGNLEGSDYFAHSPTVPRKSIVADVNIDGTPGMRYPCKDIMAVGIEHSSLSNNVEVAARQIGYEISPDPNPEEDFFIRSDQYSFVQQGVPAVWLRNGADGLDVVKKWLVTRYHTPLDNMEQQIYYDAGAKAGGMYFLLGYSVAQQDQPPTWNPNDFFGTKFSPTQ